VLQGSLIISEADFTRHFANEAGFRALMIDARPQRRERSRRSSAGRCRTTDEITTMAARLDRFNAVQNTYLNTFQILGGLGLLLGSVGLGVVVSRNVFERRGELAVLQAMGFEASVLRRFVLVEHGALLTFGLGIGSGGRTDHRVAGSADPGFGISVGIPGPHARHRCGAMASPGPGRHPHAPAQTPARFPQSPLIEFRGALIPNF
jgi:hypothetical protein